MFYQLGLALKQANSILNGWTSSQE